MTVRSIGRGIQYQFMDKKNQLLAKKSRSGAQSALRGDGDLRYGRVYKAYFFEKPIKRPITVIVITNCFERALALIRAQFPGRIVSALHGESQMSENIPTTHAVLVDAPLPRKDFDVERKEQGQYFFEAINDSTARSHTETGATGQPNNQKRN